MSNLGSLALVFGEWAFQVVSVAGQIPVGDFSSCCTTPACVVGGILVVGHVVFVLVVECGLLFSSIGGFEAEGFLFILGSSIGVPRAVSDGARCFPLWFICMYFS